MERTRNTAWSTRYQLVSQLRYQLRISDLYNQVWFEPQVWLHIDVTSGVTDNTCFVEFVVTAVMRVTMNPEVTTLD